MAAGREHVRGISAETRGPECWQGLSQGSQQAADEAARSRTTLRGEAARAHDAISARPLTSAASIPAEEARASPLARSSRPRGREAFCAHRIGLRTSKGGCRERPLSRRPRAALPSALAGTAALVTWADRPEKPPDHDRGRVTFSSHGPGRGAPPGARGASPGPPLRGWSRGSAGAVRL